MTTFEDDAPVYDPVPGDCTASDEKIPARGVGDALPSVQWEFRGFNVF